MEQEPELVRNIVATCRNNLETMADVPPVRNHAAEDEIRDAVEHLDAALVDLDRALEEGDSERDEDHVPVWERNVNEE